MPCDRWSVPAEQGPGAHQRALAKILRRQPTQPSVYGVVEALMRNQQWSPEQILNSLSQAGIARISHMTIYRHVHADARRSGSLRASLRQGRKRRRKRTLTSTRRGRLQGRPMIQNRPPEVESREEPGR